MTEPSVTPLHDLDRLASTFLELADQIAELQSQQDHIKAQLRDLDVGKHTSPSGIPISIEAPRRSFNSERAWSMLNPDQQAVCMSPDARKVKAQLPAVLLDACMDEGTGQPIVKVG